MEEKATLCDSAHEKQQAEKLLGNRVSCDDAYISMERRQKYRVELLDTLLNKTRGRQRGGLPCPVLPDETHDPAPLQGEGHPIQSKGGVALGQLLYGQRVHWGSSFRSASACTWVATSIKAVRNWAGTKAMPAVPGLVSPSTTRVSPRLS